MIKVERVEQDHDRVRYFYAQPGQVRYKKAEWPFDQDPGAYASLTEDAVNERTGEIELRAGNVIWFDHTRRIGEMSDVLILVF